MSWYDVIKDFQELIGVGVGFIGVMATLYYSGKLTRDQRQAEADFTREQRELEEQALGRGLPVEMSQMRANILHLANKPFSEDQSKLKVILPIFQTPIFDANAQNIGRLPGSAAPIVVSAYLQIQRLREFIRFESQDEYAQHYFRLPVARIEGVQRQCRVVAERLAQAVDKLMEALGDHGLPVEPVT